MIIEYNYDNMERFSDIGCGDVFEYNNTFYMKIEIPKNLNNALDLDDGHVLFFDDSKWVKPVDCKLVIN